MKKLFPFILLCFSLLSTSPIKAQILSHYGISIGAGMSSYIFDYKNLSSSEKWEDDFTGFQFQLSGEKKLSDVLAFRSDLGYIQKGFNQTITLTNEIGIETGEASDKVFLHLLAFDLALKATPFKGSLTPYAMMGLRADYKLGYHDFTLTYDGETYEIYNELLRKMEPLTLGGLVTLGVEYKNTCFLEVSFNPSLTTIYSSDNLTVRNRFFGISAGIWIDKLLKSNPKP